MSKSTKERLNEAFKALNQKTPTVPTTSVAEEIFEIIRRDMGWEWPTSDVVFEPTLGLGENVRPTPTNLSHGGVEVEAGRPLVMAGKRDSRTGKVAVQARFKQPVPDVYGSVQFLVNNIPFWMTATVGASFKKADDGTLEPNTNTNYGFIKPYRVTRKAVPEGPIEHDGCIIVSAGDRGLYAFLMLNPRCSMSPFHWTPAEQERVGLRFQVQGLSGGRRPTPMMTPMDIAKKIGEKDKDTLGEAQLISKLYQMGEAELSLTVQHCKIGGINLSAPDKRAHYIARMMEIIKRRGDGPAFKAKFDDIKANVMGQDGLKLSLKTVTDAYKFGILSHDGTIWSLNGDVLDFTVMNDPTSDSMATPGMEVEWLASKVCGPDSEQWLSELEYLVDEERQKRDTVRMGRGENTIHHELSYAINQKIILGYDPGRIDESDGKKDKNYRWAIDNTAICLTSRYGSTGSETKLKYFLDELKIHFKDTSVEDLRALIDSKTPAGSKMER